MPNSKKLQGFDEVIAHLSKNKRTPNLLLGNGFSMAFDPSIFSYNALQTFVEQVEDEVLSKLFDITRTTNFESVMQQLAIFVDFLIAFDGDDHLIHQIENAAKLLQVTLLEAVQTMHPEHVFKVDEEEVSRCVKFLSLFLGKDGSVFSTNYDLLLYWVLMRSNYEKHSDGFGYYRLDDPLDRSTDEQWSDLVWGPKKESQNVHYLHGALQIFDTGTEVEKETYDSAGYLLENISARMSDRQYPVFVAAGDGDQKLKQIRSSPYLSFCYDQLSQVKGSLVTFGFNFGEYDDHIIEAINRAAVPPIDGRISDKLWSVYIGVYSPEDRAHVESIRKKFICKVNVFDSNSVGIWR